MSMKREGTYPDFQANSTKDVARGVKVISPSVGALDVPGRVTRISEIYGAVVELVKIRITFFVGLSAAFGYVLAGGSVSEEMLLPILGIFALSCASAATNHYQEVATDALMHRTSKRPLPAGVLTPAFALTFIVVTALFASALILVSGNLTALVLSWLAFLSYNAVYTPLKKVTAYAVIPGSFVGSLPVMAGWAAAGGQIWNTQLAAIAAFFFIWQIPHFWMLMELYSVDYERANFPTLRITLGPVGRAWLIYSLDIALVVSSLFFLLTGVVNSIFTGAVVVALGIWLAVGTFPIVSDRDNSKKIKSAFMYINVYVLAVTLTVLIDKLMRILVK